MSKAGAGSLRHALLTNLVSLPCLEALRRNRVDPCLLLGRESGLERTGYCRSNIALNGENIGSGKLAIVALGPDLCIARGVHELHVDAHTVARALHAAFEDARH